jgi:hypothetical protein
MTTQEREGVAQAMSVLCDATCGGIGPDGMTLQELQTQWDQGKTAENDSMYDTCQHVYRLLEKVMVKK